MKPHIRLRYGVWSCVTLRPFVAGYAYSPRNAYLGWKGGMEALK